MNTGTLVAGPLSKIGRAELAQIPVPQATATHRPVPHHEIVEALGETLSFRHIAVVNEEYAASSDGMKMFGVLDLETQMEGCRFSIGIRNSHDKSLRLGSSATRAISSLLGTQKLTEIWKHCPRRVYTGPGQAQQEL